jgi:hypothetical protein
MGGFCKPIVTVFFFSVWQIYLREFHYCFGSEGYQLRRPESADAIACIQFTPAATAFAITSLRSFSRSLALRLWLLMASFGLGNGTGGGNPIGGENLDNLMTWILSGFRWLKALHH